MAQPITTEQIGEALIKWINSKRCVPQIKTSSVFYQGYQQKEVKIEPIPACIVLPEDIKPFATHIYAHGFWNGSPQVICIRNKTDQTLASFTDFNSQTELYQNMPRYFGAGEEDTGNTKGELTKLVDDLRQRVENIEKGLQNSKK